MAHDPKGVGSHIFRLMVALWLLSYPRTGSATGTWSVVSLPQKPGEVISPAALAVNAAGDLYVADRSSGGQIQKRDAQGNWFILAAAGPDLGQVITPIALAADTAGNLYVADDSNGGRIRKRDAEGNWSVIASNGTNAGHVDFNSGGALAVDAAGNLYVTDYSNGHRIQKRDAEGNWSVISTPDPITGALSLAVDYTGNLYLADSGHGIQKRDVQGNWSVIAALGTDLDSIFSPSGLAVDTAGNLYVADAYVDDGTGWLYPHGLVKKRDARGDWSVLATRGSVPGRVGDVSALAVDSAGSVYVADWRIQKRDGQGGWSVIADDAKGQFLHPEGIAVDLAGDLFIVDNDDGFRIQKRDARGNWSTLATVGDVAVSGSNFDLVDLATDGAGNLYVAGWFGEFCYVQERNTQGVWSQIAPPNFFGYTALDASNGGDLYVADVTLSGGKSQIRIQKRGPQGNWSVLATVNRCDALAVDGAGSLYVADRSEYGLAGGRIRRQDARGDWSVLAPTGTASGQVLSPTALAVDTSGNLYVAEQGNGSDRIQIRDAQGNWSVTANRGATALAVDATGSLYVIDSDTEQVRVYTPSPAP